MKKRIISAISEICVSQPSQCRDETCLIRNLVKGRRMCIPGALRLLSHLFPLPLYYRKAILFLKNVDHDVSPLSHFMHLMHLFHLILLSRPKVIQNLIRFERFLAARRPNRKTQPHVGAATEN